VSRGLVEQFGDVLAFVEANPGATTNTIARGVSVRRNVVLAMPRLGRAGGVLRSEPRPRRASAWYMIGGRSDWYPRRREGAIA
jgi:hypothetical protein